MDDDERRLLAALAGQAEGNFPDRRMPGEMAVALGIPQKRAMAILRRFADAGLYEYDISLYSGRLTAKALEMIRLEEKQ
ncbi:hypothetical protein [Desulfolutivibrio sulfoxidireducens]|uniref:hypothetical protein n=1 Tax=Desulfolutivibrio sulfoxidireducens TaxID=2773299 RepID=UPI00159D4245|nr:hypothetical protein [Desulfolutivibrio sulfoxidireducens]QLA16340.1 hypothetical protein GD605_09520 [Desulfolutivibrio sulfoxidireducens]QLA19769.1 hypothetical protein GD604_08485 [Desulfolutivibrio sulfoxidireducens]